jgi:hypothetical protein
LWAWLGVCKMEWSGLIERRVTEEKAHEIEDYTLSLTSMRFMACKFHTLCQIG